MVLNKRVNFDFGTKYFSHFAVSPAPKFSFLINTSLKIVSFESVAITHSLYKEPVLLPQAIIHPKTGRY